jgi:hypothetical protein
LILFLHFVEVGERMTTLTMPQPQAAEVPQGGGDFSYRPMSLLAVLVLVFGLLSTVLMFIWFTLLLPFFNLFFGGFTVFRIARSRGEYGGTKLAYAGILLSAVALAGGIYYQIHMFQTEIPKGGFLRISFTRDVSERLKRVQQGDLKSAEEIQAMDGQKIFVKGFMYPTEEHEGLRSFLLVKDSGQCCFGGKPALEDMITVYMTGTKTAKYYSGRVSVAGTFRLNQQFRGASELESMFLMDGVSVSQARSDWDPMDPVKLAPKTAKVPASASPAVPEVNSKAAARPIETRS